MFVRRLDEARRERDEWLRNNRSGNVDVHMEQFIVELTIWNYRLYVKGTTVENLLLELYNYFRTTGNS